jgi:hypothetical protein
VTITFSAGWTISLQPGVLMLDRKNGPKFPWP